MNIYFITLLVHSSFSSLFTQVKVNLNKIWISPYPEYLNLKQYDTAFFDCGMGYNEKYQLEREDAVFKLIKYDRIAGVKDPRKVINS